MSEGTLAVAVTECPHPRICRAQPFVDLDITALVDGNAGRVQREIVGVRHAADGEQQMRAPLARRPCLAAHADRHAIGLLSHADALRAETQRDALLAQEFLNLQRDVLVLTRDNAGSRLHHRHTAAEASEHLREFQTDVAATNDDEVRRDDVEVHHRDVRQVGNLIHPRYGGFRGTTADIEKDAVRLQSLQADRKLRSPDEASMPRIDGDAFQSCHPLLDAAARVTDDLVLARLHALHVHARPGVQHDAIVDRSCGCACGIRAGDHRFGRRAAVVDARPAEPVLFDDCDAPACSGKPRGEGGTGLPGADDDRVKDGGAAHANRSGMTRQVGSQSHCHDGIASTTRSASTMAPTVQN